MGKMCLPPRRAPAPGTSCVCQALARRKGKPASSQVVGRAASLPARSGGPMRMEHGWAHDHGGMAVAGGAGGGVRRTTATVLLVRTTSKGRQMYIAAFIRLKPVMTVIMAPVMTRGRSRSGCAMSPSTKPTCYASRYQNGTVTPSRPPLVDVTVSKWPWVPSNSISVGVGWFRTVSQPP